MPQAESVLGPPSEVLATPDGGCEVRWCGRKQGMVYVEFDKRGAMVRKYFIEEARDYRRGFFPRIRDG